MTEYDLGDIVVVALGIVSMVVILATTVYACWQCQSRGGIVVEDQNSGEKAVAYFMRVLKEADEQLIIHDDGDNVAGTPYNDKDVMKALEERLKSSDLKVRILFNVPDVDLGILSLARKYGDSLQIRYRKDGRPVGDIHYKIADRRMGYFSSHDEGSAYRKIWIYKFQHAPRKACDRAFGDSTRRFEQEFAEAA